MPATREALAHKAQQARIRNQTERAVDRLWRSLGAYNRSDARRFIAAVTPIVFAAQRQSASTTKAFIARRLERTVASVDPSLVTGANTRNGVPPEEVYFRPFKRVWKDLKDGKEWQLAVNEAGITAVSAAATDVQLSMRDMASALQSREPGAFGYQRVPSGSACEFCLLASTQRYYSGDLMPLHNNCGCGIDVVTAEFDPGQVINSERLAALKQGDIELAVQSHGELGPVLTNAADNFTRL